MGYRYCKECECFHADGACETVRELRGIHDQITDDDVRWEQPCGWLADHGCVLGATHRLISVDRHGHKKEDRLFCDAHTVEWSTLIGRTHPEYSTASLRLDDPSDPKLVDEVTP